MSEQKAKPKANKRITIFFQTDKEAEEWRALEKKQKSATGRGILFYRLECFRKGMEAMKETKGGQTTRGNK